MKDKDKGNSIFERNPKVTILLTSLIVISLLSICAEFALRLFVHYNPGYYTGVSNPSKGVVTFPYGDIPINSDKFPDQEFKPTKSLPRVAYIGDSVCYGVGAGYGYRVTELLEKQYPNLEHMNMSLGLGEGISLSSIKLIEQWADLYGLDKVVYLMNLNDILPDDTESVEGVGILALITRAEKKIRFLRGRSYLYTHIRYKIKLAFNKMGYQAGGFKQYELFITDNIKILDQTVQRIAVLNERLQNIGIGFVVVMLPYEMQISREAEEKYRSLGIAWDESFISRDTQMLIAERFKQRDIHYIDAYFSFVNSDDIESSRSRNALGQYFVYDKGDKLDWNHPNRKGHEKISAYMNRQLSGWFSGEYRD